MNNIIKTKNYVGQRSVSVPLLRAQRIGIFYKKPNGISRRRFMPPRSKRIVFRSYLRSIKYSKIKRLVAFYFLRRCFFWLLYIFSKLHFILLNLRFVLWLNFFQGFLMEEYFFSVLSLPIFFSYLPSLKLHAETFFTRNLFFYKTFILWEIGDFRLSSRKFKKGKVLQYWVGRRIFTFRKKILLNSAVLRRVSVILPSLLLRQKYLGIWFFVHWLPKKRRTYKTSVPWVQKGLIKYLTNRRIYKIKRAIKKILKDSRYFKNSIRSIF